MIRLICALATLVASVGFSASADAQVFYAYGSPAPLYAPVVVAPAPVFVPAPVFSPVVTAAYSYPAPAVYSPAIVQTVYAAPSVVVRSAPILPAPVVTTTRVTPRNYTQTVRAYGPTYGPHYSRVHVHTGPFGTTVRERIR